MSSNYDREVPNAPPLMTREMSRVSDRRATDTVSWYSVFKGELLVLFTDW
jgi:hypothetical protein